MIISTAPRMRSRLTTALSLLVWLSLCTFSARAQNTDDGYEQHLREAVDTIASTPGRVKVTVVRVGDEGFNYDLAHELELAFFNDDREEVIKLLQEKRLTISPNPYAGGAADAYPFLVDNANANAAHAIVNNKVEELAVALARPDIDINAMVYVPGHMRESLLYTASFYGNPEVVRMLLDAGAAPMDKKTALDALIRATLLSHLDVAKLLIEAGANPNIITVSSRIKQVLLAYYADVGNMDMVTFLLEHKANANMGDEFGWTALMDAVQKQDLALVELLLPHSNARILSSLELNSRDAKKKGHTTAYSRVTAMDIAKTFTTPPAQKIRDAIQARLDEQGSSPHGSRQSRLLGAYQDVEHLRTEFKIPEALARAEYGLDLVAEEPISQSSTSEMKRIAIYLLLYKHELGIIAGKQLNDQDAMIGKQLADAGSNAQRWHDMLSVFDASLNGTADKELQTWGESHGSPGEKMWTFDALARWISDMEDVETQNRLYDTLDYFDLR